VITEGYLVRHYQGRSGGRGPALIDLAQDHLLFHLSERGLFGLGVALKGGTAIRKLWAGSAGRFSTDLDFNGVDDITAELLLEAVNGARVGPFVFETQPIHGTQRVRLLIDGALGSPDVPARLDLGRRPLWSRPSRRRPVPLPIHARYEFELPAIPVATAEEIVAEKLARFRRTSLARDLYDLAWFAGRTFDERLVRRMTVLKVWTDVVDDGLGAGPFDPEEAFRSRADSEFEAEAIGYLTRPVDVTGWAATVRDRYAFLRGLDAEERRWARCDRGDEWAVRRAIAAFGE
jgi:predicted nucleotidyltransferase component of viral defense system